MRDFLLFSLFIIDSIKFKKLNCAEFTDNFYKITMLIQLQIILWDLS